MASLGVANAASVDNTMDAASMRTPPNLKEVNVNGDDGKAVGHVEVVRSTSAAGSGHGCNGRRWRANLDANQAQGIWLVA